MKYKKIVHGKYGNSRVEFYMEKGDEKYLMEVKRCTLEIDGIGVFFTMQSRRRGGIYVTENKEII